MHNHYFKTENKTDKSDFKIFGIKIGPVPDLQELLRVLYGGHFYAEVSTSMMRFPLPCWGCHFHIVFCARVLCGGHFPHEVDTTLLCLVLVCHVVDTLLCLVLGCHVVDTSLLMWILPYCVWWTLPCRGGQFPIVCCARVSWTPPCWWPHFYIVCYPRVLCGKHFSVEVNTSVLFLVLGCHVVHTSLRLRWTLSYCVLS